MSDLESRTQFPGTETTSPRIVQYASLTYSTIDEDEQVEITDLAATTSSVFDRYSRNNGAEDEYEDDDDDEPYWYVALTFFTSNGQEVRYFDDSSDDAVVGDVMSRVLAELGTKGWEPIGVVEDRDGDPRWYLKRVVSQ